MNNEEARLEKCDFCGSYFPAWEYKCDPFGGVMLVVGDDQHIKHAAPFQSDSGWLACAACYILIENKEKELLINRCLQGSFDTATQEFLEHATPHQIREMRQMLQGFHEPFWTTKTGPPKRIREIQ